MNSLVRLGLTRGVPLKNNQVRVKPARTRIHGALKELERMVQVPANRTMVLPILIAGHLLMEVMQPLKDKHLKVKVMHTPIHGARKELEKMDQVLENWRMVLPILIAGHQLMAVMLPMLALEKMDLGIMTTRGHQKELQALMEKLELQVPEKVEQQVPEKVKAQELEPQVLEKVKAQELEPQVLEKVQEPQVPEKVQAKAKLLLGGMHPTHQTLMLMKAHSPHQTELFTISTLMLENQDLEKALVLEKVQQAQEKVQPVLEKVQQELEKLVKSQSLLPPLSLEQAKALEKVLELVKEKPDTGQ